MDSSTPGPGSEYYHGAPNMNTAPHMDEEFNMFTEEDAYISRETEAAEAPPSNIIQDLSSKNEWAAGRIIDDIVKQNIEENQPSPQEMSTAVKDGMYNSNLTLNIKSETPSDRTNYLPESSYTLEETPRTPVPDPDRNWAIQVIREGRFCRCVSGNGNKNLRGNDCRAEEIYDAFMAKPLSKIISIEIIKKVWPKIGGNWKKAYTHMVYAYQESRELQISFPQLLGYVKTKTLRNKKYISPKRMLFVYHNVSGKTLITEFKTRL